MINIRKSKFTVGNNLKSRLQCTIYETKLPDTKFLEPNRPWHEVKLFHLPKVTEMTSDVE